MEDTAVSIGNNNPSAEKLQFSLRMLFAVMAAVAIVFAGGSKVMPEVFSVSEKLGSSVTPHHAGAFLKDVMGISALFIGTVVNGMKLRRKYWPGLWLVLLAGRRSALIAGGE